MTLTGTCGTGRAPQKWCIEFHLILYSIDGTTKEDLCIEAQERGKSFALIIKSSHFKGIFINAKGVNRASLETVRAKKYFL